MNMADVITPKSDQINADDLIGRDMTITIRDVQIRGGQEQPVSILFEGSDKAFRPCKSMSRVLVAIWGADARQYIGRSLTLYRDPSVKWGGMEVGGIRISHMSDMEKPHTMALTATKGSRKPYTVKPLVTPIGGGDAGLTLDQARDALDAATTLDELKGAWSRKAMAPHRAALQQHLDERKVALSGEGLADEQRGEAHAMSDELTQALDHLSRKNRQQDVIALRDDWLGHLDPSDHAAWATACAEKIDALKGGK
jgi:hypothetical protein